MDEAGMDEAGGAGHPMKMIMSHITAARFWMAYGSPGFPRIRNDQAAFGRLPFGSDMPAIADAFAASASCGEASPRGRVADEAFERIGELGLIGSDGKVHLLFARQGDRRRSKRVVAHSCGHSLPAGSILPVAPSLSVCSPALTFVQLGTMLPQSLLAFFGMQLCGIHAVDPLGANSTGEIERGLEGRRDGALPNRAALMTVGKLSGYLDLMPGLTGRNRALSALRLVGERSRSPMESVAFLLLCSPPSVGGFGLPSPRLNCTIELPTWLHRGIDPIGGRLAGEGARTVPYAEADMLFSYRGRKAIVDYHGEAPHEGERSLHHDALRANAFQDLGIPNFALTKRQLFDDALLEKAALQIAGCLGFRSRSRIEDAFARRRRFRRELLSGVLSEWWGIR